MRTEHCALAVLNSHGRCIAICHYLSEDMDKDCVGVTRERESNLEIKGREYQIGGRFKKHGTKLQYNTNVRSDTRKPE